MGYKNAKAYLRDANYTIRNGTKISYMYKDKLVTGYVKFLGHGGGANYAFVGMNGGKIATFGVRSIDSLRKLGVLWLF